MVSRQSTPATADDAALLARRGASSASGPGLRDVLDRLRQTLDNLAPGSSGRGSLGGIGAGFGSNLGGAVASARAGLAPVQDVARQIQRTMNSTAQAFAASMNQTTKTWKRNTTSFSADFFRAFQGKSRRQSRGGRWGKASRQAWRAASAWTRATTRSARKSSARWAKRSAQVMARAARTVATRSKQRGKKTRSAWTRSARRMGKSWNRWKTGTARRWRQTSAAWTRSARQAMQRTARSARKVRVRLGKSLSRWGRRTGRGARVAWGRAGRRFRQTGSVSAALGAGARSLIGRGSMMAFGNFGVVLTALTTAMKTMQATFESTNARNRPLAGYNAQIGMAFNQLALGDAQRMVRLGKETEGSAVTLANLVNKSRDIQGSFDRLGAGINNRVSSGLAVAWNGLATPTALAADYLNGQLNAMDPKGTALAKLAASPFATAAGVGGFLGTLWGGGSTKDATEAAVRAFQEDEKNRLAGKAPTLDPFSEFIAGAQNLGPIRPMREVRL